MSAGQVVADKRRPALLVVDADGPARERTEQALRARFGADYDVLAASSGSAATAMIDDIAARAQSLVLVAADLHLPDMDALDLLARAQASDRGCARVLLVAMDEFHTRISFTEIAPLQQAMALGRIDTSIVKGWVTPDEWLYPQVQEVITRWTATHGPRHLVYRVVGEQRDPRSHLLRDRLARNVVPFEFIDVGSDAGQQLVKELEIDLDKLPAVLRHDGLVLQDPSFTEIAAAHGMQTEPDAEDYDLIVVGAGPAGLAAAVYGASEGLRTMVVEHQAIGGQAGTSSLIRNYLGFPRGLSGGALAHQAWEQAVLFGAQFVFTKPAVAITREDHHLVVRIDDGHPARSQAVILAVGVAYRRLDIESVERLVGRGVFYGAAGVEAPALVNQDVHVVGGANSAGQAALHLARYARRVSLLVRGDSLERGMSDYLIRHIAATPNIEVHLHTHIMNTVGEITLSALEITGPSGERRVPSAALFVMIGAEPNTDWLPPEIMVDDHGFILTAGDLPRQVWPDQRPPLPFETSTPGVFAVGDARHGAVRRVAGAVGEGSVAVGALLQYLESRPA